MSHSPKPNKTDHDMTRNETPGAVRRHRSATSTTCPRGASTTCSAAASAQQPERNPAKPLRLRNSSNRIRRSRCVRATAPTESGGAAASAQRVQQNPAEPLRPHKSPDGIRRSRCIRATAPTESGGAAASAQRLQQNPAKPLRPRKSSNGIRRSRCRGNAATYTTRQATASIRNARPTPSRHPRAGESPKKRAQRRQNLRCTGFFAPTVRFLRPTAWPCRNFCVSSCRFRSRSPEGAERPRSHPEAVPAS